MSEEFSYRYRKNSREDNWYHLKQTMFILLKVVISICLLIGGIVILVLKVAVWGTMVGVPMIVFGLIFTICVYDEVLAKRVYGHYLSHGDDRKEK